MLNPIPRGTTPTIYYKFHNTSAVFGNESYIAIDKDHGFEYGN